MTTSKPQLVAGLGNPGVRYARTRHNLGFMVLDELAHRDGSKFRRSAQSEACKAFGVELVKPQTFMNLSGAAIQSAMTRTGTKPQGLLVVHDDLDLSLGRLRFRHGGSSGGQRGVQDTIARLGKDFWRLKLGISNAPEGWETANWVLSRFRADEQELLHDVVSEAADAIQHALEHGLESAANRYNGIDLRN